MWSLFDRLCASLTHCRLCHDLAAGELCQACRTELPFIDHGCQRCGLPLQDPEQALCGTCLARPPAFDAARIPFRYASPVDRLIGQLKFHGGLSDGRLLGSLLAERLPPRPTVERIVPIPLHPRRLRERGFNQAAELGREIARQTGIAIDLHSLHRIRSGPPQHRASRRQRIQQVKKAFLWRGRHEPPARVALVDDVVTTGATAEAAARCLKQAGAQWVEIWAIARTPTRP